jgi:peptide/nickel transport system permease protein
MKALSRVLSSLLLVWFVASCAFLLSAVGPAPLAIGASQEEVEAWRRETGADRPLLARYVSWLGGALVGDLGTSSLYRAPLALLVGLPPAIYAARHPASLLARAIRAASLAMLSVPPFIGALALVFLAARTGWLPAGGMTSGAELSGFAWMADVLWHLPVPALALALPLAATFERQQAAALAEALALPAVQNARAKGVPPRRVVYAHAWRLSLKPVAALGGLALAALLGGAFVVETISAWPGLGRLIHDAVRARDVALVSGCAIAGSAMLAAGIFLSDLLVAWLDPRARG